mgnify:CR=1 FL=1
MNVSDQIGMDPTLLFILFTLLLIFFLSFSDVFKKKRMLSITSPIVKTELFCPNCELKILREFKEGDYVFKRTEEKCKRCGTPLIISAIYDVSKPKRPF